MKNFKFNENYNTIAVYVLLILLWNAFCVVVCMNIGNIISGLFKLLDILKPLIYGLVIALILNPLYKFIVNRVFNIFDKKMRHMNLKHIFGLIITYLLIISAVTLLILIVIPQAAKSYTDLQSKITVYINEAQNFIDRILSNIPAIDIMFKSPSAGTIKPVPIKNQDGSIPSLIFFNVEQAVSSKMYSEIINQYKNSAHFNIAGFLNKLIVNSYEIFTNITPYIFSSVMSVFTEVKNIILGLIISIYYLAAQKKFTASIKYIMKIFLPSSLCEKLNESVIIINRIFIQFINGKIIDAIIIGILCFIFMTIIGMPYAPLIGLIVGITNIIPYIGPFLGAIPGVFIIFVADPFMVIWFILLIIGLQQLDSYVIEPYILQGQISLDSIWIIISVIIMGGFLGIPGLLIGVPVFAIIYTFFKQYIEKRLINRNLPNKTSDWININTKEML